MRKLLALILLLVPISAGATTTVTGHIADLGTGSVTSGTFARFYLRGCAGNQPRVNGTALIAPTQGAVWYKDFAADSSGNVSGTLYSTRDAAGTGNGDLECGGSKTVVWYGLQVFQGGRGGPEVPVHAKSGTTLDITQVTPITTNPVTTAPTGDTTYLRLDAGNSPLTGLLELDDAGLRFPGSSSGSTVVKASAAAGSTTLTLPAATDTLVGKSTTDTLTNKTLTSPVVTSPVINDTPSGTGIPTFTEKKGSGSGTYSTVNTTFTDIDGTNLSYTVTIPSGWKLAVWASGTAGTSNVADSFVIGISDGASNLVREDPFAIVAGVTTPFAMHTVIAGDGASHTVKLQFASVNGSHPVSIQNASAAATCRMLFLLSPSN